MLFFSLSLLIGCGEKEKESEIPDIPAEPASDQPQDCDQTVDSDCDGVVDEDDCDPNDGLVYPGAPEIPYDGKDNDCAGDGDLNDVDGDGFVGVNGGGDDCNDNNETVYPGAPEICYDNIDQDCSGDVENENNGDCDGDGHVGIGVEATDCNDEDPTINPDAEEVWYDGVDQDCDLHSDYDADFDGEDSSDHGGTDCDDTDPITYSASNELWDRVDRDCDGEIDRMIVFDAWKAYYPNEYAGGAGSAMVGLDDYDTDGYLELAVASPFANADPQTGVITGWISIQSTGSADGDPFSVAYTTIMGEESGYIGYDLANVGDLNGDGYAELVAGEPGLGKALVFSGATLQAGGALDAGDQLASLIGSGLAGIDVEAIGDVTGDGISEIAIGTGSYFDATAWFAVWDGAQVGAGGTHGQADSLAVITGTGRGGELASGVDIDGDGIPDVISASGTASNGKVAIISGADLQGSVNLAMGDYPEISGPSSTRFGRENGIAADMDQDGYAELLLASPSEAITTTNSFNGAGRVYVIDGDVAMAGGQAADLAEIIIEGSENCGNLIPNDYSGDFDGDGRPDLALSMVNDDALNCQDTIFAKTQILLAADLSTGIYPSDHGGSYFVSRQTEDQLGKTVAPVDFNQDGRDDIAIGAPADDDSTGYLMLFLSDL